MDSYWAYVYSLLSTIVHMSILVFMIACNPHSDPLREYSSSEIAIW